jgi:hypothetical protein
MTNYLDGIDATGWENAPKSYTPAKELALQGWGSTIYGYVFDTTDDQKVNYNSVAFSMDKKTVFSTLTQGQWTTWQPISLKWKVQEQVTPLILMLDSRS